MMHERRDAFAVPIWLYQLDELEPFVAGMVMAAEALVDSSPDPGNSLFQQSTAHLQRSSEPGWVRYFEILAGIMERIVSQEYTPLYDVSRAYVRSWVLRVRSASDFAETGSVLEVLHSHLPSVLTSVFYLQVPRSLVGSDQGGTVLRDPNSANTRSFHSAGHTIEAVPLRLAIFPAFVEHAPERPPPGTIFDVPRLVVSTDLRFDIA